jgi:hypothetical protein
MGIMGTTFLPISALGEDLTSIADDGNHGHHVLADLRRIDVYVDDLGVGAEGGDLSGHPVGETHADGKDDVGVGQDVVGDLSTVHSEHPKAERMALGKGALSHQGDPDRNHQGLR